MGKLGPKEPAGLDFSPNLPRAVLIREIYASSVLPGEKLSRSRADSACAGELCIRIYGLGVIAREVESCLLMLWVRALGLLFKL